MNLPSKSIVNAWKRRAEMGFVFSKQRSLRLVEIASHALTLQAEVETLREDKARLDKIAANRIAIIPCYGLQPPMGSGLPFPFEGFVTDSQDHNPKLLRAAIDAAKGEIK